MDSPSLTTQTITILTALADAGSFTLAADRLGVTQSAVSRAVAQLEDDLGVTLFTRSRTGAVPTAALESALPKLRQILADVNAVSELLCARESPLHGTIRVAGFRSAITILLPPAISAFMSEHPRVNVSLAVVREEGPGVAHVIEQGEADFGFTTVKPPGRLRSTYLGSDGYVLLRRKNGTFSPSDEQLVLWKERCSERVPEILSAQGWNVPIRLEVDTDTAVLAMVEQGVGFTVMPELATEPLPRNVERVALPGDFRRGIWLCGLPTVWETRTGRALVAQIRETTRHLLNDST